MGERQLPPKELSEAICKASAAAYEAMNLVGQVGVIVVAAFPSGHIMVGGAGAEHLEEHIVKHWQESGQLVKDNFEMFKASKPSDNLER